MPNGVDTIYALLIAAYYANEPTTVKAEVITNRKITFRLASFTKT